MRFEDQRNIMVLTQLRKRGITDERIIEAFLAVPRHEFVPEDMRAYSYNDHPLSIGEGQTISQPYIVALMMTLAQIRPTDHVLEIGAGSGYQTALLARLADQVYTVERIGALMRRAKRLLKSLGYNNIHFRTGDGARGWEMAYPPRNTFDCIIVAAGAPSVPQPLIDQLADGGRLVIPSGTRLSQEMLLLTRHGDEIRTERHGGCAFVPLIGDGAWPES